MAYGGYKIEFEGTLGADAEVSQHGERSVLNVRIAHKARVKRGDGHGDSETTWFKGVKWASGNQVAELHNIAASLAKGDMVHVSGAAFAEAWQSRDGSKSGVSNVLEIDFIGPSLRFTTVQVDRSRRGGGGQQQSQQQGGWGQQSQPQGQQGWGQPAAQQQPAVNGGFGGFDDEQTF